MYLISDNENVSECSDTETNVMDSYSDSVFGNDSSTGTSFDSDFL